MKIYIGKILRNLRAAKDINQQHAASLLFVSRQTYKKWESDVNEISQTKLFLIAEVFEIPIDKLVKMIAEENKIKVLEDVAGFDAITGNIEDIKKQLSIIGNHFQGLTNNINQ